MASQGLHLQKKMFSSDVIIDFDLEKTVEKRLLSSK
jgi:hypothetical protein